MPYVFTNYCEEGDFTTRLDCRQCAGRVERTAARCKNRTCVGLPYCWQHTEKLLHLKVRESEIEHAGKGVFAWNKRLLDDAIIFRPNDTICEYFGELLSDEEKDRRYHNNCAAPYTIQLRNDEYEDAARVRGLGAMINHNRRANVKFIVSHKIVNGRRRNLCKIKATRIIRNKQELLVNYGRDYDWNAEHETTYR